MIVVLIFTLHVTNSCKNQRANKMPLLVTDSIINLGNIYYENITHFDVVLKNDGEQKLSVDNINTPCGCLYYEYQNAPIFPLDTFSIRFSFKPSCHGYTEQNVFIYFDQLDTPIHITMKARIK